MLLLLLMMLLLSLFSLSLLVWRRMMMTMTMTVMMLLPLLLVLLLFFKHNFCVKPYVYPENPEGINVIVGSMKMELLLLSSMSFYTLTDVAVIILAVVARSMKRTGCSMYCFGKIHNDICIRDNRGTVGCCKCRGSQCRAGSKIIRYLWFESTCWTMKTWWNNGGVCCFCWEWINHRANESIWP